MNWSRARLKEMSRIALHGSYWKCVLVALILAVIEGGTSGSVGSSVTGGAASASSGGMSLHGIIAGFFNPVFALMALLAGISVILLCVALDIFFFNPLEVGGKGFFNVDLYRPASMSELGSGFRGDYWNTVKTMFFKKLYTFLWSLLLVIPGIVKSYEYMMIPYLLSENPNMPMSEAFARSKEMMQGEKWNAFVLDLSFILWHCLGLITFGIVEVFYVRPYVELTHAGLYGALKQKMQMQPGSPA